MDTVGRNDPCPCGSGKKYKKCCLALEESQARARPRPTQEPGEARFVAELRPDVDQAADRLLARLERGERQGLEAAFKDLFEQHPHYHTTNYAMGVFVGMVRNDPVAAIPYFEKAVRLFPPLAEAHYNLGGCYFKAAHVAEAAAAFRNAIRYSDGADGIDEMAREKLRELERIIRDTSPFPTLDAFIENQKLFDQAYENLTEQRYEQAVALFRKVLEQNPRHVQSHGNLALAQAGLGHKAAALESLDRALTLDPAYEPARVNRQAIASMNEGQPLIPETVVETEYYREEHEAGRSGTKSWRQKLQFWKRA